MAASFTTKTHRFADRNPDIKAAGKEFPFSEDISGLFHVPKSSKSDNIGVTGRKLGDGDRLATTGHAFGLSTDRKFTIDDVIRVEPTSFVLRKIVESRDKIYKSSKEQTLGKSKRFACVPSSVDLNSACFGVSTRQVDDVKTCLYPPIRRDIDEEEAHKLYLKTHQSFEVGEVRHRGYNNTFEKIKDEKLFGAMTKADYEGMKNSIKWENPLTPTNFVNVSVDSSSKEHFSELGNSRRTRNSDIVDKDKTYGSPPQLKDGTVKDCLTTITKNHAVDNNNDNNLDDDDVSNRDDNNERTIGKSQSFRGSAKIADHYPGLPENFDRNRVFGLPTKRFDLKKPKIPSITNTKSYSDEIQAAAAIFPGKWAQIGVFQDDLKKLRSEEELYSYIETSELPISEDNFRYVLAIACSSSSSSNINNNKMASIEQFLNALDSFRSRRSQ